MGRYATEQEQAAAAKRFIRWVHVHYRDLRRHLPCWLWKLPEDRHARLVHNNNRYRHYWWQRKRRREHRAVIT
jgi:hypothetical protein